MTERTTLIQARIPTADVHQADKDAVILGLGSRSAAVREGLRLLHQRASQAALAQDYDNFYDYTEAPLSDIAAIGDRIAVDTITNGTIH